jgi:hypothetical protein
VLPFIAPVLYFVALIFMARIFRKQGFKLALSVLTSGPRAACVLGESENGDDSVYVLTARKDGVPVVLGEIYGTPDAFVVSPLCSPGRLPAALERTLAERTKTAIGGQCEDVAWRRFKPVHDYESGLYL